MKNNIATLRKQLQLNKIKSKKTLTEWTLEDFLNSFKVRVRFPVVAEFAILAIIVPVSNAWPDPAGN